MTTNALDRFQRPAPAQVATQTTQVEQARAVAEVQAAVIVAQQNPRDMSRADAEMRDSCARLALASRAFYSVPNRGNGPSVHLARELARIWGNVDYGVHELRRDDAAGMSEVRAFAWDQQTNVRSTRTFQVPHERMKGRERQKLVDLGDIYLTNQNVGARAVRECIFTVLPTWFTEQAQELCRATLENGEGVPLPDRIALAVDRFAQIGVTVDQLEQWVGRKRGQWTAGDVAELGIAYTSVTRGDADKDEVFPPKRVTADDIKAGGEQPRRQSAYSTRGNRPAGADQPISKGQLSKLHASFSDVGIADRTEKLEFCAATIGRPVESTEKLTGAEASKVIDALAAAAAQTQQDAAEQPDPEPDDDGWNDEN